MQTLHFNTRRPYTKHGQRVAAAILDNGDIVFVDIDRGIDGVIRAGGLSRQDMLEFDQFTQRAIMLAYDTNRYALFGADAPDALLAQLRAAAAGDSAR